MALELVATVAGAWLWENYGKEWVGSLGGGAKDKWTGFHETRRWKQAAQAYREALFRDHATIRVLGVSGPVPLEGIFTDVYILDKVTARHYYDIEELRKEIPDRARRYLHNPKRVNGLKLVQDASNDRLFILGKPGAGKTTFLRYLTLQAVQGKLDKVPIFVGLKDWSMKGGSLLAYMAQQFALCHFPAADDFISHLLESGQALVCFDGLDEVNREDGLRDRLTAELDDFCRQYHASQCLLTCRIAATEHAFRHFQEVELADFNPEQIRTFVKNWFRDETLRDNSAKREAFFKEFDKKENEGVRELGSSPLLLTLLCLAFNETMTFPQRRAELYEDAIAALLRKWDAFRSIKRDVVYQHLSLRLKQRLFAHLAATTFESGDYFLEERRLVKLIEDFMGKLPQADKQGEVEGLAVLKDIESQHSLLVERAKGIYSFSHLTFHEYFTAKYIADNEARSLPGLMQHITDARWREVFLLTVSLLAEADDFAEQFLRAVGKLVGKDEMLVNLLACAAGQADTHPGMLPRLRSFYLVLARALDLVLTRAFDIVHDLVNDRVLVVVPALALDIVPAPALDIDIGLAPARAIVRDLGAAVNPRFGLEVGLFYAWQVAAIFGLMLDLAQVSEAVAKYGPYLAGLVEMSQEGDQPAVTAQLNQLALPPEGSIPAAWASVAETLLKLLRHEFGWGPLLDLDKDLQEEQWDRLTEYLEANELLVRCLELALVKDRAGIMAQMLLPPG